MTCGETYRKLREETGKIFTEKVLEEEGLRSWQWLQLLLESLSCALDLPMLAIDLAGVCVCGTRAFQGARGFQTPNSSTLAYALQTGNKLTRIKGDMNQCRKCPSREICRDQANFTGPVSAGGQPRFVVQLVAQTPLQHQTLLLKAEQAFSIILASAQLAFRSEESVPDCSGRSCHAEIEEIVGESPAIRMLKSHVIKAAQSESTVLIQGESGTGKELVANAVHAHSRRSGKPFVALNCAAIPEALMESEIFGYDAGAFSGANPRGKKGLMETAHGGTLFLDEIADMPVSLQAKLLRALQERSFLRVGGKTPCRVDVRIIAAANRSLRGLVEAGTFREDLYFRLNVLPLRVPPLRERTGDVRLLTGFFLNQFSANTGRILHITSELLNWFENYSWPGNIRELKNFIEYGVNFCENGVLDLELMRHRFEAAEPGSAVPARSFRPDPVFPPDSLHVRLAERGRGVEAKRLLAAEMGISLATLYRRLHEEKRMSGIL